jgi:mannitol-1-phosphate/altronate dehydrogenase
VALQHEVEQRLGVRDECAVFTEPFTAWVIEDQFSNRRPPLDAVGAQFVSDARPYRDLKARLLNASHCALGHLGTAAGYTTTAEAMRDPALSHFVEQMMQREIAPLLEAPAAMDVDAYQREILTRISSPSIPDPLSRLSTKGMVRIPSYVVPSLRAALERDAPRARLTLVVAAWISRLRHQSGVGSGHDPVPREELLQAALHQHPDDPRAILAHTPFADLARHVTWPGELQAAVRRLQRSGVHSALAAASYSRLIPGGATHTISGRETSAAVS